MIMGADNLLPIFQHSATCFINGLSKPPGTGIFFNPTGFVVVNI